MAWGFKVGFPPQDARSLLLCQHCGPSSMEIHFCYFPFHDFRASQESRNDVIQLYVELKVGLSRGEEMQSRCISVELTSIEDGPQVQTAVFWILDLPTCNLLCQLLVQLKPMQSTVPAPGATQANAIYCASYWYNSSQCNLLCKLLVQLKPMQSTVPATGTTLANAIYCASYWYNSSQCNLLCQLYR